jgi:N-acetyl-1-D-myo-inositol-2-amino-2-deoxy-alpha-D-glucopyranoside deacetylase
MATIVSFHAHPDDESIATGGTLAHAAAEGHRVVLVFGTRGECGEVAEGFLADGEELGDRREQEVATSATALGAHRFEFLGYRDSGMMGWETNHHPNCFWQADHQEAARRLVSLIRKYKPDVMTIYDPHGGYGHPDHVNVHRIGMDAFYASDDVLRFPLIDDEEPWRAAKLYMNARSRSRMVTWAEMRMAEGSIDEETAARMRQSGVPDELVTCWVDVREHIETKLDALRAHRTQIPPDWSMLTVPDDKKDDVLGTETFVRVFGPAATTETDLFEGL